MGADTGALVGAAGGSQPERRPAECGRQSWAGDALIMRRRVAVRAQYASEFSLASMQFDLPRTKRSTPDEAVMNQVHRVREKA